jgi:hypothetical protein
MNHISFRVGRQGLSSSTTPIGSFSFSLLGEFGNNYFSSAAILTRGNPVFGSQNPMQGTIPAQGAHTSQGPWNPWQGSVPSSGMSTRGNPFHGQWSPRQGSIPILIGSAGGNPFQNLLMQTPYLSRVLRPPSLWIVLFPEPKWPFGLLLEPFG